MGGLRRNNTNDRSHTIKKLIQISEITNGILRNQRLKIKNFVHSNTQHPSDSHVPHLTFFQSEPSLNGVHKIESGSFKGEWETEPLQTQHGTIGISQQVDSKLQDLYKISRLKNLRRGNTCQVKSTQREQSSFVQNE